MTERKAAPKSSAAARERRRRRTARAAGKKELSLRLDGELWQLVQDASKASDRTASSLIRQAIRHYCDHLLEPEEGSGGTIAGHISGLREGGLIP